MKRMKKIAACMFILAALMVLPAMSVQAKTTKAVSSSLNNVKKAKALTGTWIQKQNHVLFQADSGEPVTDSWISLNGSIYYLNAKGYRVTGWISYNDNLYYTKENGKLHTGWLKLNGEKYYLKENNGRLARGFCKIGENKYFFSTERGVMRTGWRTINGSRYYFSPSGKMAVSKWVQEGSVSHYLNASGKMAKSGWVEYKDKKYYLDDKGVKVTGTIKINGEICHFDKDGVYQEPGTFTGTFIFVGDSRMVGMSSSVSHPRTKFIAKDNTGYTWLKGTAGPSLRSQLKGASNVKVVLAHGVNDTYNIKNYIAYYKTLIRDYPSVEFYVLSVNPIEGSSKYVNNTMVEKFNQSLRAEFENIYIDSYTYLKKTGFKTRDSVHYLASTNKKIYDYIISKIG